MIKLNNKGFAVSTILYGILSLTIIILMIIFAIVKSSKDMNQELTESAEEYMNECILSEIELEQCYFEGGTCDASKYNDCIGNKEFTLFLHEEAQVGDFVEYDSGVWPENGTTSSSKFISFGGYNNGESRNDNSTSCGENASYTGWRIFSIEGNVVTLIHAGIPECMQIVPSICSSNCTENYLTIVSGNIQETLDSTLNSSIRDWSSYVNSDYASSAKMLDEDEWTYWLNNASESDTLVNNGSGITDGENKVVNDLIHINEEYYLGTAFGTNITYVMPSTLASYEFSILNSIDISTSSQTTKGIRPVVVLKENIKTSGSITNTYGKKSWILVK